MTLSNKTLVLFLVIFALALIQSADAEVSETCVSDAVLCGAIVTGC
jgi:hypothetical protein